MTWPSCASSSITAAAAPPPTTCKLSSNVHGSSIGRFLYSSIMWKAETLSLKCFCTNLCKHPHLFTFFFLIIKSLIIFRSYICACRYLNAIQTMCPHILRYLATAVIINRSRRNALKDLVKVIQQEAYTYRYNILLSETWRLLSFWDIFHLCYAPLRVLQ